VVSEGTGRRSSGKCEGGQVMKKAVALIAAVAMAGTSVAGYGATTVKADDKKEIYVLIKARGDLSYWDSMANGGDRAAEDFADEANVHVIETTADTEANLSAMYEAADNGADLIISAGDFLDNMMTVADEYPDCGFLLVNEKMEDVDNIYSIDFRTSEAGFLGGIAAADVAKQNGSDTIGFIGGMDEVIVIQEFFMGYIQGAKYYNPDIKIVYNYVGDWGDPDKGRTQALAQFNDSGVEVIFACAGGSGNGVHQAASEVGKYVIGVDSDQSATYTEQPDIQKTFVTSCMKKMDNGIYNTIQDFLENGTLPYGQYDVFGLKDDAVGIVENDLFNEYVSEDGKKAIEEATAKIDDGSIEVKGAINKEQSEIQSEISELLGE